MTQRMKIQCARDADGTTQCYGYLYAANESRGLPLPRQFSYDDAGVAKGIQRFVDEEVVRMEETCEVFEVEIELPPRVPQE